MWPRLAFLVITLFWVTMNVLLWRSEIRGKSELGGQVPVEAVWQKMLIAPDDSNLDIVFRNKKIGSLRWTANVGEEISTGKVATSEPAPEQPEGRISTRAGYTIDIVDGSFDVPDSRKRLRFNFHADFATNHTWREFTLRLLQRPLTVNLSAHAEEKKLQLNIQEGDEGVNHTFAFADLQNTEKLLQQLGNQMPLGMMLGGLAGGLGAPNATNSITAGLEWTARYDWMKLGHAPLRVYRLQARLFDRHQVVVLVSRVGEIMRVELPNEIKLVNSAFSIY
jgi:hypothetical protein